MNTCGEHLVETRTESWQFSAAARAVPAVVTVAVPSLDHGRFLDESLRSIAQQRVGTRMLVADAGSRGAARMPGRPPQ